MVQYFLSNHIWSQGMMFGIEMWAWGPASLGRDEKVGGRLENVEFDKIPKVK